MNTMNFPRNKITRPFNKISKWFIFLGITMMLLGLLAIIYSFSATIASIVALGFLLSIAGVVLVVDSFKYWPNWPSFLMHCFIGMIYIFVGFMLVGNPLLGSISITLLLGIFYVVIGAARLINASYRFRNWNILSGVLSILIGILILISWPSSSLFIIGLFIGIDLLFYGWALTMLGLAERRLLNT